MTTPRLLTCVALLVGGLAAAPAVGDGPVLGRTLLDDHGTDGGGDGEVDATTAAESAGPVDVTGGFEQVGDWSGPDQSVGSALGQDLVAATIGYAEDTFTFTIAVTELLAVGGTPEATRYGWSFAYEGQSFELDGKFTNYSRGACDPTAGSCPPPRDPGVGFFALRGNCTATENVTTCEELGGVNATFDPATATISIPLPAELLTPGGRAVEACDTISGEASFLGGSVWAAPSAFVTFTAFPNDQASHFVPLVVPAAHPEVVCGA